MKKRNKIYLSTFLFLLLTLLSEISFATQPSAPTKPFHLTGSVKYVTIGEGFYGIVGDDGKKYQPTNLPRQFRKKDLPIKFDMKIKDEGLNTLMWGTVIELSNIKEISPTISMDERSAIYILLKRITAFNNKNLTELQQIDLLSRQLTKVQFDSWLGNFDHYTLHYVDLYSSDSSSITGVCYYTRELTNKMTLHGNIELSTMTFTLTMTPNGWEVTQSGNLNNPSFYNEPDVLAYLKQKALEKYHTDNLSTLWQ